MNNSELTDKQLAKLKADALQILTKSRCQLMHQQPFIGTVAMNFDIMPVRDVRVRTACTDSKTIYFDIDFLSKLNEDERLFVFAHECWHAVMMHFMRCETRNHELFNIATDLEVNQILKKDGFIAPNMVLFPELYQLPTDLSAEQYYELLIKKNDNNSKNSSNSSSKNGGPSNGANNPSKNGSDKSDSGGSDGSGSGENKNTSGNANGELNGQFDKHVYEGENEGENGQPEVFDKYGKVGFDKDFTPSMTKEAAERMREAAVSAAQSYERSRGSLPGHIADLIKKLTTPEIPWQEALTIFVSRCFGDTRRWNPPNRRHVWNDTYLQSRKGDKIKIGIGIDTSGSTAQDMSKFLSEVNSIFNSFGRYEIHVIQCDTQVTDYHLYDDSEPLNIEVNGFNIHGGGGTELRPIFNYVDNNGLDIDAMVMFTDGEIGEYKAEEAPGYPVMWILTNDAPGNNIHFGEIKKFKNKNTI